jgi:uncharacterized membrane protein YphA (DoxX/SURF4 family)
LSDKAWTEWLENKLTTQRKTYKHMSDIGRIFYGTAIAGIGFPSIYYKDFPYILFPAQPLPIPALVYIIGTMFILVGACIVFEKKIKPVSLLFGLILLMIFCFYHIPYEFGVDSNYKHLPEWDNAGKLLALAGGAFFIAGYSSEKNKNSMNRFWGKSMSFGSVLFSLPILLFGILQYIIYKRCIDHGSFMGVPSCILDLCCGYSINGIRHCNYF